MRFLVDTDYLISAAARVPSATAVLDRLVPQGVAISIVTVAEFYEGALGVPEPEAKLAALRTFLAPYDVLPITDPIAERFARIRYGLRRQGLLIPDVDLLIAATALESGLILVTRNRRHFERIPELRLHQP